jgi:8-oxo-dGTP diphosphatase
LVYLLKAQIRVGVGAVVIRDGKVLLVKRRNPPSANKWSLPGGHVEPWENILEAAARELKEETGVIGSPVGVIDITDLFVRDEKGALLTRYVIIDVLMEAESLSNVTPGSDALEASLVPIERVLELDLSPSTRRFFEKILSRGVCSIEPSLVWVTERLR